MNWLRATGKLRIDCPSVHKELSPILQQSGFTLAATPPVMIRNAKNAYSKSNIICSSSTSFRLSKRASLLLCCQKKDFEGRVENVMDGRGGEQDVSSVRNSKT